MFTPEQIERIDGPQAMKRAFWELCQEVAVLTARVEELEAAATQPKTIPKKAS